MESYHLVDTQIQLGIMKNIWRWTVVMVAQQCEYT